MLETAAPISGVTLGEHDDGRIEVLDAPPVAEITCALLGRRNLHYLAIDEAGNLIVADTVVYRPLRLRQHLTGEFMLVCERVR